MPTLQLPIMSGILLLLSLAGLAFLAISANERTKQIVLKVTVVVTCALGGSLVGSGRVMTIIGMLLFASTMLLLRPVAFCHGCGGTVWPGLTSRTAACGKCGAKLATDS